MLKSVGKNINSGPPAKHQTLPAVFCQRTKHCPANESGESYAHVSRNQTFQQLEEKSPQLTKSSQVIPAQSALDEIAEVNKAERSPLKEPGRAAFSQPHQRDISCE